MDQVAVAEFENVRRTVIRTFRELGVEDDGSSPLRETTILCDRSHAGRRFQCDDVRAVWFSGRDTIEFFSDDGEFLCTANVTPKPLAAPVAAA